MQKSVSTFNDLFVEELILNGINFNVENFKGAAGEPPTIDTTSEINRGDKGDDWSLRYETVELTEANVPTYYLPNPATKNYDFTAIQVKKNVTTSQPISIYTHDHKLVSIMYPLFYQTLHMLRSPTNEWVK
jgi:hypothetical protein